MFSQLVNWLEEVVKPFEDFIVSHADNPLFWAAIVVIGMVLFSLLYGFFHKND